MTVPRAKRRTAPFRTLEQLGAEMLQFHGGMGDPIYAAGSYYLSGRRHPSREIEVRADHGLTMLYEHPDPTWTKKDMTGLWRAIITMARLLEFDPKSRRDITLRRKGSSRDAVGSPEREALLRAVGLGPERGVRYNFTTPQLRQMVKAGQRIRVGRDPAYAKSKKQWKYFAEDLPTGKRTYTNTMGEAKELAKQHSITTGNVVAVVAVDMSKDSALHPQGAYYGRSWRGGAYHYSSRLQRDRPTREGS